MKKYASIVLLATLTVFMAVIYVARLEEKESVQLQVESLKVEAQLLREKVGLLSTELEEIEGKIIHDDRLTWIKDNQDVVLPYLRMKEGE